MKVGLAVFCLVFSSVAFAGEQQERGRIHETVTAMFLDRDFAALEGLAEKYRVEESRTPSGVWKLAEFYNGLTKLALDFPKGDDQQWVRAAESIDQWIQAFPDSPTPYVAKGAAMMNRGWAYRGEGWLSSVADEDLHNFRVHAYYAAVFLMEHMEVGSRDPHWYFLSMDALRSIGTEKGAFLELASEGLDRYPKYDPLYFKLAGYLSPKWYGSLEELEAFAQKAIEQTRATRGYELYARIYWASGLFNKRQFAFQGPEASWPDMIKGMDEVISRYPDQWNINHFAYFACYKQDYRTTKRYLEMVEEPVPEIAWGGRLISYQKCRLNTGMEPSPNIPMP